MRIDATVFTLTPRPRAVSTATGIDREIYGVALIETVPIHCPQSRLHWSWDNVDVLGRISRPRSLPEDTVLLTSGCRCSVAEGIIGHLANCHATNNLCAPSRLFNDISRRQYPTQSHFFPCRRGEYIDREDVPSGKPRTRIPGGFHARRKRSSLPRTLPVPRKRTEKHLETGKRSRLVNSSCILYSENLFIHYLT
ncbi:uncharacterized protein LOC143217242 [Lasioglossum baleicum]|uniref:uncharacterized protein LOC143217242 n=1 Tax=Lasioglossum baleicum TaxID=434251 RepID=UPI003FCEB19D